MNTYESSSIYVFYVYIPLSILRFAVGDACTPPEICGSKKWGPYFTIEFLYGMCCVVVMVMFLVLCRCSCYIVYYHLDIWNACVVV